MYACVTVVCNGSVDSILTVYIPGFRAIPVAALVGLSSPGTCPFAVVVGVNVTLTSAGNDCSSVPAVTVVPIHLITESSPP